MCLLEKSQDITSNMLTKYVFDCFPARIPKAAFVDLRVKYTDKKID